MRTKDALVYLTGADYLKRHMKKQENWVRENIGRPEGPVLPVEGDLKTTAKVYGDRAVTIVAMPVVVLSRITGVDAAVKGVRKNLAKANK